MSAARRPLSLFVFAMLACCAAAPAWASDGAGAKPAKARAEAESTKPAPAGAAATTLSTEADALEQLRQRLAGRLAGGKAAEGGSPNDLRIVVARSEPAPAPKPSSPAAAVASKPGPPSAAKAAATAVLAHGPGQVPWGYQGPTGPQHWGSLRPEFALCGSGQRQSPIDIRGGLAVDLEPPKFSYQASRFGVIDNGRAVQVNMAPGNFIELAGKRFDLQQMYFHRPSEARIDGRQFEMSVHLVHKDEQGRQAMVAVLIDKGQPQPAVQKVLNNLPLEKGEETIARVALDLSELLPSDRRFFTYMGSLTVPPCSEGVQWVVMRQPVTMSPEQIELFARIYPMNARPVQQAGGRRILQSQ
jgi:carbonic anhydrase